MLNIKETQSNKLSEAFNSGNQLLHENLENRGKPSSTIVFIDSAVDDYQSLVDGAIPEAEVIVLDSTRDGVEQITEVLQERIDIAAIHIFSHGSPGCLDLGNTQLSLGTLERYASQLQTWATHLTLSSLLLYGCNVAAGDAGEEFVQELHQLTGANIAASAERIGNAAKGGSWYLEHHLGQISTGLAFLPELMQAYSGVFAVSFNDASNFPVGTTPSSIATGDFNGDGDLDLVTANFGSNNVSVLLGNGNGSFGSATNFTVGQGPSSVAVTDFNGDGNQDLAVGNFDGTVSVLLGNGAGSFALASQPTVPNSGFSISVGDFNNDNNPDIVIGGQQNEVSLLLGTGTGDFQPAQQIPTGVFFASAGTVGDFNGDGNQDLVVGSNSGAEDEIAVLLGNGNGSFGSPSKFTTGGGSKVAVGDFNLDGQLDIAAASAINNNVSVLLGNGDGGFVEDGTFNVGSNPLSITMGDFNGDSKRDIATVNSNSNNVSVLLNTITFDHLSVDTLVDENDGDLSLGDVSLREAIAFTKAGGTINFDPSLAGGTITLTQGELAINKDLTIEGLGADQLTISGNNASPVFEINDGNDSNLINVGIEGLTITNGFGNFGGGINNNENLTITDSTITDNTGTDGGGIYNNATLTIANSTISNNSAGASSYGGGINNSGTLKVTDSIISGNTAGVGGGIANGSNGTVEVIDSTISDNSSTLIGASSFDGGGGISNGGILTVTNSTISGNTAKFASGGGIDSFAGTLTVTNSTISGNTAGTDGGGIESGLSFLTVTNSTITNNKAGASPFSSFANGGGISSLSGGTIKNTIIAGNSVNTELVEVSRDVYGSFSTTDSNLIGDATGSTGFENGINGNIVGTSTNPIDPKLGPLQDNGGPTFTHALLDGSPAVNAGNNANIPTGIDTDQRGEPRIVGSTVDIGAFESAFTPVVLPIIVTPGDDTVTGTPGNDTVISGGGQDQIFGGSGNDVLDGGDGDDRVSGGEDNDTLLGGSGQDQLFGDNGSDSLDGGDGDDRLSGGEGNDTLLGGQGQDRLFGDSGDDLLNGGTGDNILTGGLGKDIFVVSTAGKNNIVDFEDGQDLLKLEGGLTFGQLSIFEQNGDTWITTNTNQPLAFLTGVDSNLITAADFTV